MIKRYNLQFFGGRGSGGGNAVPALTRDVRDYFTSKDSVAIEGKDYDTIRLAGSDHNNTALKNNLTNSGWVQTSVIKDEWRYSKKERK